MLNVDGYIIYSPNGTVKTFNEKVVHVDCICNRYHVWIKREFEPLKMFIYDKLKDTWFITKDDGESWEPFDGEVKAFEYKLELVQE